MAAVKNPAAIANCSIMSTKYSNGLTVSAGSYFLGNFINQNANFANVIFFQVGGNDSIFVLTYNQEVSSQRLIKKII